MFQVSSFKNKGFTMIELIVVMAVFMFVLGAVITIFIYMIQYQKRILSEQELLNQANYFIENMTKAIRMAKKDGEYSDQTASCLKGGLNEYPGRSYLLTRYEGGKYHGIKFINQSDNDACYEFFLDDSDSDNPVIKKIVYPNTTPVALTSTKFKINFLSFGINGQIPSPVLGNFSAPEEGDLTQPRITVFIEMEAKDSSFPAMKIQTTISQRSLNAQ